jgi:deoxyribose-phosphate aldolase
VIKSYNKFLKKINESNQTSVNDLKNKIDYTQLDPNVPDEELYKLADIATDEGFATLCVMPNKVKYLRGILDDFNADKGSNVGITTVVSFPHGTDSLEDKSRECEQCIDDGADEIDMVLNYQKLKEYVNTNNQSLANEVSDDITYLADLCYDNGLILKVIVESGNLTEKETEIATLACIKNGADFIKTSTGKVDIGAEINKVKIMYDTIKEQSSNMKIKASGGIRTADDMLIFEPYVDRYGIGFGSVNTIYEIDTSGTDNY